jgi:hypothetical protein
VEVLVALAVVQEVAQVADPVALVAAVDVDSNKKQSRASQYREALSLSFRKTLPVLSTLSLRLTSYFN